jgi:preprotein translocase subunit YajC
MFNIFILKLFYKLIFFIHFMFIFNLFWFFILRNKKIKKKELDWMEKLMRKENIFLNKILLKVIIILYPS